MPGFGSASVVCVLVCEFMWAWRVRCYMQCHVYPYNSLTHWQVFNADRSNKTVVVEEGMTTSMVCHLLVVKNHFDESPNWVLVEQLGDVSLG